MTRKFLTVMMLGGMLATTGVYAQDKTEKPKRDPEQMFNKLDADKDGKLSKEEVDKSEKGRLKENFTAIDTNKDTYLDKDELKAYRKERMGKIKKQR